MPFETPASSSAPSYSRGQPPHRYRHPDPARLRGSAYVQQQRYLLLRLTALGVHNAF